MRLLAYTSPARGHLYPIVPIIAELATRGHEVHVRTLADELEHLAAVGISGTAIAPGVEATRLVDWTQRSRMAAGVSLLQTIGERAQGEARELTRAIGELSPDLVLIDVNCWGAAAAAEASGRAWAMYSPCLLPLPSREGPPVGMGWARRTDLLGVARDRVAQRLVSVAFDRVALPAVNEVRRRCSLPRLACFADLLRAPPLLLALIDDRLEYPRDDWPPNLRTVGPVAWAPPLPSSPELPAWVADMAQPLALVTGSTEYQADERLIEVALEGLPAARISVLATAAAHDPRSFSAPPGCRVARFLPHEAVLKRAACVVCHGGMGITQKALAAGVALVVVPFERDQFEVARRVELAQAGVRLPARRLTPDRLVAAVRAAIEQRIETQHAIGREHSPAHERTPASAHTVAADALEDLGR
jgi:UDP:flavonoid glycosyltransferase YjiC (YdhE family)